MPRFAVFGVFSNNEIVGLTGIALHADDPSTAGLWGSWLHPDVRGRGLSIEMYQARITWARSRGVARILVSHRRSNLRSKRANQRFGFQLTHAAAHTWSDGLVEDELHYALVL